MIIVKLSGGLGNQLFQYAFARAVSTKLKTTFKLDAFPFSTYYKLHKYSLGHFKIQESIAKKSDLLGFVWLRKQNKVFDWVYGKMRGKKILLPFYYPEQTFAFDKNVFTKKTAYFDGFWQTEKYFKDIEDDIRNEILLDKPLSEYSQKISNKIEKTNAISLHIRRADYIASSSTHSFHGTCSVEYYKAAIDYMASKVESPHFFIFSDDYQWSVDNFKSLPYPSVCISNTAEKNYEDLTLMSRCKHNIIANSSFSWWGAWLNQNKSKIVIAPKKWFANASKNNTRDLVPDSWIKM